MDFDSEQQFLASYKEHADALFRYCLMKISDRELAKDLLQDILLKSWQYLEQGNKVDNMKAFLFRTARNTVIDEYRKKKTNSLDALRDQGFDVGTDDHSDFLRALDGERALLLLGSIPENYRDPIYMQYVEGLSVKEIAEVVGETENNVSVRIHRGLQKLRTILREQQEQADARLDTSTQSS